jgi:hypothetical protein
MVLMSSFSVYANCSAVPPALKQAYGSDFYRAFEYQSLGKSIVAFTQFQVAYESAKKAGESIYRLMILEQLFVWYRTYGSYLRLFAKNPEGYDRIVGEYKRPFSTSYPYKSEWGKTPEQAAIVREFMLGVAETISGVLCVSVGAGTTAHVGIGLFIDGSRRIFTTLNALYASQERAIIELKMWEENAKNTLKQD